MLVLVIVHHDSWPTTKHNAVVVVHKSEQDWTHIQKDNNKDWTYVHIIVCRVQVGVYIIKHPCFLNRVCDCSNSCQVFELFKTRYMFLSPWKNCTCKRSSEVGAWLCIGKSGTATLNGRRSKRGRVHISKNYERRVYGCWPSL